MRVRIRASRLAEQVARLIVMRTAVNLFKHLIATTKETHDCGSRPYEQQSGCPCR